MKIKFISPTLFEIDGKKCKLQSSPSSRSIYIGQKFVIKTKANWESLPYKQTLNEIKFWTKKVKKEDKKYFPKVLAYSVKNKYIITERIKFKKGKMSQKNMNLIQKLIQKYDFTDVDVSLGWRYNCGTRSNGKPVIYDFAY